MNRVPGVFLASVLAVSVFLAVPAFGGALGGRGARSGSGTQATGDVVLQRVAGASFFGEFTNSCGATATSCMAFDTQGNITFDQDFGDGPVVFTGVFDERALGPLSFWEATLDDASPDGEFTLSGIAFAGILTFMRLENLDVLCSDGTTPLTASGLFSGRGQACTPGVRSGPSRGVGESAVGGLP